MYIKHKLNHEQNRNQIQQKKKKVPGQTAEESKRKENPQSKIERKRKNYIERSKDQTIFEQYRIVTSK